MADERVTATPHDRLTNLCDGMTDWMDRQIATETIEDPTARDVRAIVFLDDGEYGGIVVHNYDNMTDALVDLFVHVQAMFRSQGRDIEFVAVPDSPAGL